MELKGKIIKILPLQTGTSSRGEWRKQEFVVETPGQYPKQACLYMWGDAIDNNKIAEGMEVTASIEIESREYNGKWYTNVKAWRVQPMVQEQAGPPQGAPNQMDGPPPVAPFSEPRLVDMADGEDDLPF